MSYQDWKIYGAAPVASMDATDPVNRRIVRLLRLWCEGPDGQETAWSELARDLGPGKARPFLRTFEQLFAIFIEYGERPLMRHGADCKCVGSDEAAFAQFVRVAAEGEREDALLMAMLLVRPDVAPAAVALAQQVGLRLLPARAATHVVTGRLN